jgi:hypothetical protein
MVLLLLEPCFGHRIYSRIRRCRTFARYLPKIFGSSTHQKQEARTVVFTETALPFPLRRR